VIAAGMAMPGHVHFPPLILKVEAESFPIAGSFTIARGSRTEALVVTATVSDGQLEGRGECVPYKRYGESVEGVLADIGGQGPCLSGGGLHATLIAGLKAGAARNALDCALWDLAAKRAGRRVWELAGRPAPQAMLTCYTLSLGNPEAMREAAEAASARPLLKVKLGGGDGQDAARIRAVRAGAPGSRLVVDANEGWRADNLAVHLAACADMGVELVEQPLPAADDAALEGCASPVILCADESVHERDSLAEVARRYGAVNIKLDKTGGLTEAFAMADAASALGLKIMVGCMVGTSLAMAPAMLIAAGAAYVDLDGPLLLARDREPGLTYDGSMVLPYGAALWG
jgi:L-alanine-DL-glutamate epimerase-like enolase superfamily enzyme